MNLDVTFGQYCEGHSFLHKMDPRAKIIAAMLYIVVIFIAKTLWAFAALTVSAVLLVALSRISPRIIVRGLKPLTIILIFTVIINIFWLKGDTLLFEWFFIHIYFEGILNALMVALRIVVLLLGSSVLLTYTTTPIALTDGLEQLLAPLAKLKLPVHEFSMMMTIALRFIPTLMEETQKIMNAQKARGADFSTGSLMQRTKALVPILVPLFISAFRRADELATAMECRCYTGGEGRTRMNILQSKPSDWVFNFLIVAFGVGIFFMNRMGGYALSW